MKTYSIILILLALITGTQSSAQTAKKETIKVSGNCGMCKSTIEKAAKSAGATFALWNEDSKVLTVKYTAGKTDNTKIQQAIAKSGYDTERFTATDEAYDKLHGCCKYERTAKSASDSSTVKKEQK